MFQAWGICQIRALPSGAVTIVSEQRLHVRGDYCEERCHQTRAGDLSFWSLSGGPTGKVTFEQ